MDETLIKKKKWTTLLKSLRVGSHSKVFPSTADMLSLVSVGYRLNQQGYQKHYSFNLNYQDKIVFIQVNNGNRKKT